MKITYYAVKNGKKNGIYRTWDECKVNVLGFPGAEYKGFCSDTEAKRYLDGDTKVPHETIYASPVCNKPVVVSDSEQTKVQTAASAGEILTKFKFQIYHNEANGFSEANGNLIVSMDSKDGGIDSQEIQNKIDEYLL